MRCIMKIYALFSVALIASCTRERRCSPQPKNLGVGKQLPNRLSGKTEPVLDIRILKMIYVLDGRYISYKVDMRDI